VQYRRVGRSEEVAAPHRVREPLAVTSADRRRDVRDALQFGLRVDASTAPLFEHIWQSRRALTDRLSDGADPVVGDLVLAAMARAAFFELDEVSLRVIRDRMRELPAHPEVEVRRELVEAWWGLLVLERGTEERFSRLRRASFDETTADVMIDAACGEALWAGHRGEPAEAVRHAKAAMRIARAQGHPLLELWSHLTLTRSRRMDGSAHLAALQLAMIEAKILPRMRRWLAHERAMATGHVPERSLEDDSAITRALSACDSGNAADFGAASTADALAQGSAPFVTSEVAETLDLLDTRRRPSSPRARAWIDGSSEVVPNGVAALLSRDREVGFVVRSDDVARRIGARGLSLLDDRVVVVRPEARPSYRTFELAARLALAPTGLADGDAFSQGYGFAYDAARHRNLLDALVSRARRLLTPLAELRRASGRIWLDVRRALAVWDPRCEQTRADQVLSHLARRQQASAAEIARTLDIPLRTIQAVLQEMVESGACVPWQSGKELRYRLDDQAVSALTASRFSWPGIDE
jgi:hypothetical protein